MKKLSIRTSQRCELVDVTGPVARELAADNFSGLCLVYVPHTTAGVVINENADPSVPLDISGFLEELVPHRRSWRHLEGNADSHVKASLVGNSVLIAVEGGKPQLGTWQGIFFCEFDGPRSRQIWLRTVSAD